MVGWVIDSKYKITSLIGEGGMSAVYEAEHLGLDRRVAIKVLHPSLADDPEAIARLQQEAQIVTEIGHAGICEIYDLGRTADGTAYLVMERLYGQTLSERIEQAGAIGFAELAPIAKQVLAALSAAHAKGILHRDLKPENVFVEKARGSRKSSAKLLDFGISKSMTYDFIEEQRLTHTGMVMGTPYYMAPEQARGDGGLDQRVDLWAVGVVLYEALSGRRPFVANNYNALLVKILTAKPRPLAKLVKGIPKVVCDLVEKAMSKLREDRYQTANEFVRALESVERRCAMEDPHAPTLVMNRKAKHSPAPTRPQRVTPDWDGEIEDPETCIDDDMPEAEGMRAAAASMARAKATIPGPVPPPGIWSESPPFEEDSGVGEPCEPTIQDVARDPFEDPLPYEEMPPSASQATEYIQRRMLEPERAGEPERPAMIVAPDSGDDTDVMNREEIFRRHSELALQEGIADEGTTIPQEELAELAQQVDNARRSGVQPRVSDEDTSTDIMDVSE